MRETAIEFAYCCASVADDDCVFAHRFVEEVYGPSKGGERFTVSQNGGISLFKQSTSHFVRRSECIFHNGQRCCLLDFGLLTSSLRLLPRIHAAVASLPCLFRLVEKII